MTIVLIVFLVLGAVGLFLALPGGPVHAGRIGLVLLAGAGGVLCAVVAQLASPHAALGDFLAFSLVAIFAGIRVITHRKPVHSALYFVLLALSVTGLLGRMGAQFVAVVLVLVYAGAILVTYMFVIMLAQQSSTAPYDAKSREPFWGCLAGFVLLAIFGMQLFATRGPQVDVATTQPIVGGTVEMVGVRLFTQYVVAIQIMGVLLLAAMVGAIAIARRRALGVREGDEGGGQC